MQFRSHHVSISVASMAESIRFYETFGFRVVRHYKAPDGSMEVAHLKLQESFLEIFWFKEHQAAPISAGQLSTDLTRVGVKHLALQAESVDEAKSFVEAQGYQVSTQPVEGRTGVRYFFVKDPSGNLLEVLEDKRGL